MENYEESISWFDSPYYPILYRNRDLTEASEFISALLRVLRPEKNSRILDLACGRGRHSIYLSTLGYQVTGLDSSSECIFCSRKSAGKNLEFFEHDMRQVFRKNYFHLVFNLFTSFGYFEKEADDLSALQAVWEGLLPDGMFVLDFLNMEKAVKDLVSEEGKKEGGIEFNIKRSTENNFLKKTIHIIDGKDHFHFEEKVKMLKREDFERYFSKTGFRIVQLYGDYRLNEFDPDDSERLIWVVQKITT